MGHGGTGGRNFGWLWSSSLPLCHIPWSAHYERLASQFRTVTGIKSMGPRFRTAAVPSWGQTTWNLRSLSQKLSSVLGTNYLKFEKFVPKVEQCLGVKLLEIWEVCPQIWVVCPQNGSAALKVRQQGSRCTNLFEEIVELDCCVRDKGVININTSMYLIYLRGTIVNRTYGTDKNLYV